MTTKKMVLVTWQDAQDNAHKWVDEEDAVKFGEEACTVTSMGFLISKTDKYITLGADWDDVDKDYGRVTKIPVGVVQTLEDLHT